MTSKDVKIIRSQLRQIAKEVLPEAITQAFYDQIAAEIKKHLKEMDQRHKETMMAILRNIQPATPPKLEDK
jgi:negative regulator of sigma E activity